MVLDHVLLVFPAGVIGELTRDSVTRASLPLFCVVMGSLAVGRPLGRRLWVLLGWGVVASGIGFPIGIGQPDILLLLAAGLVIVQLAFRWGDWWFALVLLILQPVTWPVPWTGYQLGTVCGLQIAGALMGRHFLSAAGGRLPGLLAEVGKRPLEIYIGHLFALYWLAGWLR
jgi:hypothetical protein